MEYEGEYLNGRKYNGKGFDEKGNVIYELINGNGLVKEYDEKIWIDHLIYEGEYINGERNGKGKEYDIKNRIIYEGEYLKGKRHGKGKEYDNDNIIF